MQNSAQVKTVKAAKGLRSLLAGMRGADTWNGQRVSVQGQVGTECEELHLEKGSLGGAWRTCLQSNRDKNPAACTAKLADVSGKEGCAGGGYGAWIQACGPFWS